MIWKFWSEQLGNGTVYVIIAIWMWGGERRGGGRERRGGSIKLACDEQERIRKDVDQEWNDDSECGSDCINSFGLSLWHTPYRPGAYIGLNLCTRAGDKVRYKTDAGRLANRSEFTYKLSSNKIERHLHKVDGTLANLACSCFAFVKYWAIFTHHIGLEDCNR